MLKIQLMKKIVLVLLFSVTTAFAQKELWGYKVVHNQVNPEVPGENDGQIIKTSLEGLNQDPEIVYTFDVSGMNGKFPRGKLFQASNGKLYGVTGYYGGTDNLPPQVPLGVLFEYDPVVNIYRVVSTAITNPPAGVIEPIPGILYGLTDAGNSIFKYTIATETFNIVATIPRYFENNGYRYPKFLGELMKASDGNLYGVTAQAPSNLNTTWPGGIYRLNLTTNQITKVYVFGLNDEELVTYPIQGSKLVEGMPGKLFGTAYGGTHHGPMGVAFYGSGTLYEYTIATNSISRKFDFDYTTNGSNPGPVIAGGNNKIYGTMVGTYMPEYINYQGSIFEYDMITSNLSFLHHFSFIADDFVQTPRGNMLKASDGNLYGANVLGCFQYNLLNNTVHKKINSNTINDISEVIEICRKPSYQFFDNDTFDACTGSTFTYDVQNTNAVTYQWMKGNVNLTEQTTRILNLTDISPSDAGNYTCLMTNECGTTITMPLHLTVNCLGTDTFADLKKSIKLFPNPTKDILNIKLPENIYVTIKNIKIANSLGQLVLEQKVQNDPAIDVSQLETGIYLITLTTNYGHWNGKFVKK